MTPKPPDHIDRPACERRQPIPVVRETLAEKLESRAQLCEMTDATRALGVRDAMLMLAEHYQHVMAEAERLDHDEGEPSIAVGMRRAARMMVVR